MHNLYYLLLLLDVTRRRASKIQYAFALTIAQMCSSLLETQQRVLAADRTWIGRLLSFREDKLRNW
jgi:hypothetical protein